MPPEDDNQQEAQRAIFDQATTQDASDEVSADEGHLADLAEAAEDGASELAAVLNGYDDESDEDDDEDWDGEEGDGDDEEEDEEDDDELEDAITALRRLGFSAKRIREMSNRELRRTGLRAKEMIDDQARAHAAGGTQKPQEGEEGGAARPADPPPSPEDAFRAFAESAAVDENGLKQLAEGFTAASAPFREQIQAQSQEIGALRVMVAGTIRELQRARLVQKDESLAKGRAWQAVVDEVKVLARAGVHADDPQKLFDRAHQNVRGASLAKKEAARRRKRNDRKQRGTSGGGEGRRQSRKPLTDQESKYRAAFNQATSRQWDPRSDRRRPGRAPV